MKKLYKGVQYLLSSSSKWDIYHEWGWDHL